MKNLFNQLEKEENERKKNLEVVDVLHYLPGSSKKVRFSERMIKNEDLKEKLHKYRRNLAHNKLIALKPDYHFYKERILLSPELSISNKMKKRKPLVDKMFNL